MRIKLNALIFCLTILCYSADAQLLDLSIDTEPKKHILEFADKLYPSIKGNFKLIASKQSNLGFHYSLVQQYKFIDIFGTYLILHVNAKRKLYHYQSSLFDGDTNVEPSKNTDVVWFVRNDNLIEMSIVSMNDIRANPWLLLINKNDTFQKFPLFLSYKDSLARAKIFFPNPIVSAHSKYGYTFIDNNDANSTALAAQLKVVELKTRFENGLFYLQNEYLTLTELSNPRYPITQSSIPQFYFNRSQYQFEDVNAFYHLAFQIDYLQKLGFKKLIPKIRVDAHGLLGADQSLFKFSAQPNTIEYGTGGVDDAEDAEVVVHEYGHALSQSASPNTTVNATTERLAIEEGWADYLDVSHFKKLDDYNWEKIFDWDGHNEFWEGINTNTQKHYPEDMQNRRDADRELWSTPLLCISDKLGKPTADSLLLQLLYFQTRDATMPQMAEKLIYIDTLLFYGDHYRAIKECFIESGILHKDHRDLFQGDLSDKTNYRFVNTSGFANNDGPLGIKFNHKVDCILSVYDLCGRLIIKQNYNRTDIIILEPEQVKSGLYVVRIEPQHNAGGFVNFYINEKVMKW